MNVPENLQEILDDALAAGVAAGNQKLMDWFDGHDGGACGFAWVHIYDDQGRKIRKNSKLGKALEAVGIDKDWQGAHMHWGGGMHCQNIDAKEAACQAFADVFKQHGFEAYVQSRLD
tara:strand:- start:238 stop:588 length:351 start_codon:yes stop_codon:yes gene_type:complete